MISAKLRRELLERFANDRELRPLVPGSRLKWNRQEHLRFHEALLVLPDDCTWQDVADFIGTKTRTQTLSRALSLHRRYAGIGRVRPRRHIFRVGGLVRPAPSHTPNLGSAPTTAEVFESTSPFAHFSASIPVSVTSLQHVRDLASERTRVEAHSFELNILVEEVPGYLIPCVIDEISAFLRRQAPINTTTSRSPTTVSDFENSFIDQANLVELADRDGDYVCQDTVTDSIRGNELVGLPPDELVDFFERIGAFSSDIDSVYNTFEPLSI